MEGRNSRYCSVHRPYLGVVKHLVFISVIVLVLFSTCKKDDGRSEPCPCNGIVCHEELKAWTYFKEGTWWVYEEESTGARDCVYVYSADDQWIGAIELFEWRAHSQLDDFKFYYKWQSSLRGDFNGCRTFTVERTKTRPGDFVGTGDYFIYPFFPEVSFFVGPYGGELSLGSKLDSFVVGEMTFHNVPVHHIDDCPSEGFLGSIKGHEEVRFYHAKNIGIIRKERIDAKEVWNLIEYAIIQ